MKEEGNDPDYYASHPSSPNWIRVEDALPAVHELIPGFICSNPIVAYSKNSEQIATGYVRKTENGIEWRLCADIETVSHWMDATPPQS